ncbi:MAG TPA: G5 domain-containing protein [Armatimonadota bacterium]|nr:G5 domain-containing protein [Armatimonadota bacterium]
MRRRKSRHAVTALCVVVTLAVCIAVTANRTDVAQAQASTCSVTVIIDGNKKHIDTTQTTVSAVLKEAGIKVDPDDKVNPEPDARIKDGMEIKVVRVVEKVVLQKEPVAFSTRRQPTNELRVGLTKTVSEGEPGLKHLYYKVRYEDGVVKKRELMRAEVVVEPKDRIILIGDRSAGVSRGAFKSRKIMRMTATAYDPGPRSCGPYANGKTAIGLKAGYGVVAVDPKVIPMRTKLYIEGYGYAIAGDTGSAIKGNRIDLGFDTYAAAKRFGRRSVVVHILE